MVTPSHEDRKPVDVTIRMAPQLLEAITEAKSEGPPGVMGGSPTLPSRRWKTAPRFSCHRRGLNERSLAVHAGIHLGCGGGAVVADVVRPLRGVSGIGGQDLVDSTATVSGRLVFP
jgi:hypothetical protein